MFHHVLWKINLLNLLVLGPVFPHSFDNTTLYREDALVG